MQCTVNTVASVVYAESRGESELGMRAVVHTILNRAKEQDKNPCSIVKQKRQFARGIFRPLDPNWQLAKQLVVHPGKDITRGAQYFHNRSVRPYWIRTVKVTFKYGGHIFYKAR